MCFLEILNLLGIHSQWRETLFPTDWCSSRIPPARDNWLMLISQTLTFWFWRVYKPVSALKCTAQTVHIRVKWSRTLLKINFSQSFLMLGLASFRRTTKMTEKLSMRWNTDWSAQESKPSTVNQSPETGNASCHFCLVYKNNSSVGKPC